MEGGVGVGRIMARGRKWGIKGKKKRGNERWSELRVREKVIGSVNKW